jgi:ABC-type transport system involved in multi-copper enzyme maturation permease subunit
LNRTNIIFKRDLREFIKTNSFIAVAIIFAVITVAAALITTILLNRQEWLSSPAAYPILKIIISLITYFLPFFVLITFIWVFSSLPVTKEKVNGVISSLMATPLSPGEILLGKSLAIFIPALIFSIISTLAVLITLNYAVVKPATGNFIFPLPALVTGLGSNSLLFFGLTLFIILVSLAGNPVLAIAPSFIIGFGLMIGIPLGVATGKVDISSWSFSLWYLGGVVLFSAVVLSFLRMLTRENIVMSEKGM